MSNEQFLKITYHGVGANKGTKLNAYLNMPSPTFAVLLREIGICLFEQRKQPRTELRTYWIDEDNDEIDIVDQRDYEIFMNKRSYRRHLQVAPIIEGGDTNTPSGTTTGDNVDPSSFVIHERVECDGCSNAPIIGFRYKCIQCPNYDLCERCEAQHKHSEHMMVRMPNDNCPSVVEAWVTGRSGRRHKRNMSGNCPFAAGAAQFCGTVPPTTADPNTPGAKPTDSGKDHHSRHSRKFHRRHMQHGIFTHLYNMMQDLAEGGGPVGEAAAAEAEQTTNAAHDAAHESAKKAAAAAATFAHNAAHEAAVAAANAATAAAAALNTATESTSTTTTQEQQKSPSTGAVPKTPPPTPNENSTTAEEPTVKKTNETNTNNATKQQSTPTTPYPDAIPVLGSPILENVAQFVDPQYMKAGIQILNNFSEMFAKMLDPMDGPVGNDAQQCPFQAAAFPQQGRKNSTSSTTSSNTSTSTSASNSLTKETEQPTEQNPLANADQAAAAPPEPETVDETTPLIAESTPERRRSQSEENDWQMIDNHTVPPPIASVNSSIESIDAAAAAALPTPLTPVDVALKADAATATAAAATIAQQTQTAKIDYNQLSKDLREHIAEEKQKEEQAKLLAAAAKPVPTPTPTPSAVPTPAPAPAPISAAAAAAIAREEEKRTTPIYHPDPKINKAVLSMMAMGFSNEGAWLTQLLESVNGSIPQALDVMSAAQRNAR